MDNLLTILAQQPGLVLPGVMFYVLSAVLLFAGLMVITARNPVHSVLFLILAFFNAAGLFLLLGAEFVAMILVIVYVGAVAVLFLFVVMMLDIDFATLRRGFIQHLPLGLLAAVVIAAQTIMLAISWQFSSTAMTEITEPSNPVVSNTVQIGKILYTDYMVPFQVAGVILLVAMIGAIVLTHRERTGTRKQKVASQNARLPSEVLKINTVSPGDGA